MNQWEDFSKGDGYEGSDHEHRLLRGDQIFITADYSDWAQRHIGPKAQLKVTAGRQFFQLGSGIAYNNVADGIKIEPYYGPFQFTIFGSRSIVSQDDIDQSRPNNDDSRRLFGGWK
jgi:hypothetical protein